jgi:general secretion pathway protein C
MGLDATLKRYFPVIIAVMIAIIAYFQAVGLGQILATAALGGDEGSGRATQSIHRRAPPADFDHATSAAAILDRNPFDSVTGPIHPKPQEGTQPENTAVANRDPYDDPPCTNARALLIASSADPEWSFAAIAGNDGKTVLKRRGEEIDGQKIFFVGDLRPEEERRHHEGGVWDRVWLTSSAGTRCQLALGAKPINARGPAPAPVASGAPASAMDGKIRKISETQFEVDRSAVEQTIANPAELMKARIFPVRDGERVVGMRLMGIRQNTLLGSLGMQNGDVLTSINGFEMNDPQRMLEAYSKLMKADNLTATVMRGGRPVNIEFHIK